MPGALPGFVLARDAHARLLGIDAAAAGHAGVRASTPATTLLAEGIGPLPCPVKVATDGLIVRRAMPGRWAVRHSATLVALRRRRHRRAGARMRGGGSRFLQVLAR